MPPRGRPGRIPATVTLDRLSLAPGRAETPSPVRAYPGIRYNDIPGRCEQLIVPTRQRLGGGGISSLLDPLLCSMPCGAEQAKYSFGA
jgi:hypothetical protein